jgi:hypothetical protein
MKWVSVHRPWGATTQPWQGRCTETAKTKKKTVPTSLQTWDVNQTVGEGPGGRCHFPKTDNTVK